MSKGCRIAWCCLTGRRWITDETVCLPHPEGNANGALDVRVLLLQFLRRPGIMVGFPGSANLTVLSPKSCLARLRSLSARPLARKTRPTRVVRFVCPGSQQQLTSSPDLAKLFPLHATDGPRNPRLAQSPSPPPSPHPTPVLLLRRPATTPWRPQGSPLHLHGHLLHRLRVLLLRADLRPPPHPPNRRPRRLLPPEHSRGALLHPDHKQLLTQLPPPSRLQHVRALHVRPGHNLLLRALRLPRALDR